MDLFAFQVLARNSDRCNFRLLQHNRPIADIAPPLVLRARFRASVVTRYGATPKGIAFFDDGGRYIITVMRSDRTNYASNALWAGYP
jgi:hypothetical protein